MLAVRNKKLKNFKNNTWQDKSDIVLCICNDYNLIISLKSLENIKKLKEAYYVINRKKSTWIQSTSF